MGRFTILLFGALMGQAYGYGYYDDFDSSVDGLGSGRYSWGSGNGLLDDFTGSGYGDTGLLGGVGYAGGWPDSTSIRTYYPRGLYSAGLGRGYLGSLLGSLGGLSGSGVGSTYTDSLALRRQRGRLAGTILGSALGGMILGGLLGRIGRMRHHHRFGSQGSGLYRGYGDGYGYGSTTYSGYNRPCTTCAYRRRPCYTRRCY